MGRTTETERSALIDVAAHEEVTFGPFSLNPGERRLTRDGVAVPLAARALDILTFLAARPSQPVSKRELLAEVWPDVIVGEASLRFHVANLRKALGDGRGGARYIATLSGRGYCFVAAVSHQAPRLPTPALSSWTGNLPSRPPLIGRDDELADLADLIRLERLVTIVGPGGVGKTRLAIAAGWRAADDYPDGVWLVDLAPLSDPALVVSALATALDLAREGAALSVAVIRAALRDRRLLLILDNCEHLVGAAAELTAALIDDVPGLTVLATSQEALRLDAERVYRLDPLALPPPDAAEVAGYGAVALFTHRARAVDRRFELDKSSAAAVADICRRLDGVALSLEMAAARVPSLGVEGVRSSLEARLQLLSAGLRTADIRHQTLRSTVAWSIGLLDETEALVFRRLGVFAGGCSLESAIAVVAAGEMDRWAVADALARLVDKSVVTLERGGPPRYRLLETLRLYARELLEANGEWEGVAEAHAQHVRQLFIPTRAALQRSPLPEWQSVYLPELDNLRSAQDWAFAVPGRRDLAVELTAASGCAWHIWGLIDEGVRVTGRAVSLLDDRTPPAYAAEILRNAGVLHRFDRRETRLLLERAAAIFREMGDEEGVARTNVNIVEHHLVTGGKPSEVAALLQGAREVLLASGSNRSLASALNALGMLAIEQRDLPAAIDHYRALREMAPQLKDSRTELLALGNLAVLEFTRGDVERAIELGREAVSVARGSTFPGHLPVTLHNLAAFSLAADRLPEARPAAEEALSLVRGPAMSVTLFMSAQMWALIATMEGRHGEAARLIGWVDAAYASASAARNSWEQTSYERLQALLAAQLSPEEILTLAAEGARWDAEQAVSFAFDRIVRVEGTVAI